MRNNRRFSEIMLGLFLLFLLLHLRFRQIEGAFLPAGSKHITQSKESYQ